MERFVHRGKDGKIVDVDEFQVAKALLAGEVELLSQEVDSKHLFELCCHFGHQSTAAALFANGVPGCRFDRKINCTSRPPKLAALMPAAPMPRAPMPPRVQAMRTAPSSPAAPVMAKSPPSRPIPDVSFFEAPLVKAPPPRLGAPPPFTCDNPCYCAGVATCPCCSWGFLEDEGLWMDDFDASLQDAKNTAEAAAAMPLVRTLLEAFRSQKAGPSTVTEEAMAYLLDVAILLGDAELARCCAKHCTQFPLRRWRF